MTTDPGDRDEELARALRAIDGDTQLDDIRFERLARRIGAAGAAKLASAGAPPRATRAGTTRELVRLATAAVAAAMLVAWALTLDSAPTDARFDALAPATAPGPGLHPPDRGSLLAASAGAVPEDEFLRALWGRADADALLAASVQP